MQETFHAELTAVVGELARIILVAGQMMTNASISLHQADLRLAEFVISRADEMQAVCDDMDQRCLNLLVVQAPLAMHAMRDLMRMGNLAQNIAEIARLQRELISDHLSPVAGDTSAGRTPRVNR